MDLIAEIKEHIAVAENDDKSNDIHRWEAARLIWTELEQTHDSLRELGEKIGKSHMFVQYMKRAWEISGAPIWEMSVDGRGVRKGPVIYPDFKSVYYSQEVRGKPKSDKEKQGKKPRKDSAEKKKQQKDESAHGMVTEAARLVSVLAENTAFWPFLSPDDIDVIGGIIIDAERILAGCRD